MVRKYKPWCPVCKGKGGWDRRTNIARFMEPIDTRDTYMSCVWCGTSNTIGRVVIREVK